MDNDFALLFDAIKGPRDLAEVLHLALATGRKVYITGKSIRHDHNKVKGLIDSWKPGFRNNPKINNLEYEEDYFSQIYKLRKKGYTIVGTSPNTGQSLFETDFSKEKQVIVFGTETSGLNKEKMAKVDYTIRVPMQNNTRFYTLATVTPIIVYEIMRQKGLLKK